MSDRLLNLVARWSVRLWDHAKPREIQRLCALMLQLTLLELRELLSERFENRYIIVSAEPPATWSAAQQRLYKAMIAETLRLVPLDSKTEPVALPEATPAPPEPLSPVESDRDRIKRRK